MKLSKWLNVKEEVVEVKAIIVGYSVSNQKGGGVGLWAQIGPSKVWYYFAQAFNGPTEKLLTMINGFILC